MWEVWAGRSPMLSSSFLSMNISSSLQHKTLFSARTLHLHQLIMYEPDCSPDIYLPACCSRLVFPENGGGPELDLQSDSSTRFVGQQHSLRKHWKHCLCLQIQYVTKHYGAERTQTTEKKHLAESSLPATPSSRTSPSSMRCTIGRTAAQMHAGKTAWGGCSMWWVGVCSVVFSSSGKE